MSEVVEMAHVLETDTFIAQLIISGIDKYGTCFIDGSIIKLDGAKAIAKALTTNQSLTRLSCGKLACQYDAHCSLCIERTRIRDEGASAIAAALATNQSLTHLTLGTLPCLLNSEFSC